MTNSSSELQPPKVFISYSWDNNEHKKWIKEFASQLRSDGIDVALDQWDVVPGDQLPHFMENAIRLNSFVLIVCTPNYKKKSDLRQGGVGYEGNIMTGELFTESNQRKFLPILRTGTKETSIPLWLNGKYWVDLTSDPYSMDNYNDLLSTLLNCREKAPPIGTNTAYSRRRTHPPIPSPKIANHSAENSLIRVEGVLIDELGKPRNDGTRGSALYSIPFKLNFAPSSEWSNLFVQTWDNPPRFTTRHRPGIAEVVGDRIILTRTTIEEVKEIHRDTLKLVVEIVNAEISKRITRRREAAIAREIQQRQQDEYIRRLANEIDFD
ncbi:TIR domain-containing protein [Lacunimicrobium album]